MSVFTISLNVSGLSNPDLLEGLQPFVNEVVALIEARIEDAPPEERPQLRENLPMGIAAVGAQMITEATRIQAFREEKRKEQ